MTKPASPQHWVFSNNPEGYYKGNVWDMATVLSRRAYTIKQPEPNQRHIRPGDIVYMRIYGGVFIGRFVVGGHWNPLPSREQKWEATAGAFPMSEVELWPRPVPQDLILHRLSNQNRRARIIRISRNDADIIETVRKSAGRGT